MNLLSLVGPWLMAFFIMCTCYSDYIVNCMRFTLLTRWVHILSFDSSRICRHPPTVLFFMCNHMFWGDFVIRDSLYCNKRLLCWFSIILCSGWPLPNLSDHSPSTLLWPGINVVTRVIACWSQTHLPASTSVTSLLAKLHSVRLWGTPRNFDGYIWCFILGTKCETWAWFDVELFLLGY